MISSSNVRFRTVGIQTPYRDHFKSVLLSLFLEQDKIFLVSTWRLGEERSNRQNGNLFLRRDLVIAQVFLILTTVSTRIKRGLWKCLYQVLARYYKEKEWTFMNYGYAPPDEKHLLPLKNEDKDNRLYIQLYEHALSDLKLEGKDVLEVGSGRGGGASYVARYLSPSKIIGIDYSKNATKLATSLHKESNLRFVEGDAEKLPFDDNTFDIVYNVESSHCYGHMEVFVSEVFRVLKAGGIFAWVDVRVAEAMKKDDLIFMNSNFKLLFKEEITPNIVHALDITSDQKERDIIKHIPWPFKKSFGEFVALRGSQIYEAFRKGSRGYWRYRFQKPS